MTSVGSQVGAIGLQPSANSTDTGQVNKIRSKRQGLRATAKSAKRAKGLVSVVLSIAIGLGIWQLLAELHVVNKLFLPPFSSVVTILWDQLSSGTLNNDLAVSAIPLFAGLGLTLAVGTAVGLLMGRIKIVQRMMMPWVMTFNAIPRIALIPMIIIILGIGVVDHIFVVFLSAIFPMIINVAAGSANVDSGLLRMARSFHVSRRETLRLLVLPATIPYIVSGFRIAIGQGLIGIVVAELFVSSAGIGHRLFAAGQQFDTPEVYAMVVLIAAVGIVFSQVLGALERRLESWKHV